MQGPRACERFHRGGKDNVTNSWTTTDENMKKFKEIVLCAITFALLCFNQEYIQTF